MLPQLLFLQSKVEGQRRSRGRSHLEALKASVTQQLQEEAQSPANLARLKVEVDYENKKLETSIAKEEKRVKQEAKKADSQKQKAVDAFAVVTTVLLVFEKSDPDLKEAGATGKKAKKQYAMTLWSDGPNVVPFSNFRGLKSTSRN